MKISLKWWRLLLQLIKEDISCLFIASAEATGQAIAVIDLAWPDGLQVGLTEPVALMIDEDPDLRDRVSQTGYRVFTDEDSLKEYVSSVTAIQLTVEV